MSEIPDEPQVSVAVFDKYLKLFHDAEERSNQALLDMTAHLQILESLAVLLGDEAPAVPTMYVSVKKRRRV